MRRSLRQFNKGLTLIEVMAALLIAMIIIIGVLSYMYACALNARAADTRITATRIGQLMLDTWKVTGPVDKVTRIWDVTAFNPTVDFGPSFPENIGTTGDGILGIGPELGRYETTIDGVNYYITLSYRNDFSSNSIPLYMLNASVAWSRDASSSGLGDDPYWIDLSSYAIY